MQLVNIKSILLASTVLIASVCDSTSAHGSGFGIFTQGASALGQANAVVAHTDEPSVIFFNPALLNKLQGTQVEAGTTLLFPSREFRSAITGASSRTEDTFYHPSTFYVSHTFNDKISAGLGIFNPFGLGTEWNENWEGKYLATKSSIITYNFNPVISYQITSALSFAAGLDVMFLDATLENKNYPSNAQQKFKGDGIGLGYNLGLVYDTGYGISGGVSYRSEVEIDIEGNFSIAIPGVPSLNAKTSISLPRQLLAGLAYQATDRLTVESGFRWEDWRSYKKLKLDIEGQQATISDKYWHDTFAVNIGGKYRLNDTFTMLGGYLYGWNPIPDNTFEPGVPDSNTHLLCVGTEMKFNQLKLAVSYAYQLQEERRKNNMIGSGAGNGIYNSDIHLLGISLVYKH